MAEPHFLYREEFIQRCVHAKDFMMFFYHLTFVACILKVCLIVEAL